MVVSLFFSWRIRIKSKQIINKYLSGPQDELISCRLIAAISKADGAVPGGSSALKSLQHVLKILKMQSLEVSILT